MAARYSLNQIGAITSNKVFFDANILIYIFFSTGRNNWEENYASVYGHLLKTELELCINFLVLSEIVNKTHRIEYKNHCRINGLNQEVFHYKEYRNSQIGLESLKDIYTTVEYEILTNFTVLEDSISNENIKNFLVVEPLDFVDKAILHCCKKYGCVLLTNDSDYKDSDIDILTSLPRILNN